MKFLIIAAAALLTTTATAYAQKAAYFGTYENYVVSKSTRVEQPLSCHLLFTDGESQFGFSLIPENKSLRFIFSSQEASKYKVGDLHSLHMMIFTSVSKDDEVDGVLLDYEAKVMHEQGMDKDTRAFEGELPITEGVLNLLSRKKYLSINDNATNDILALVKLVDADGAVELLRGCAKTINTSK